MQSDPIAALKYIAEREGGSITGIFAAAAVTKATAPRLTETTIEGAEARAREILTDAMKVFRSALQDAGALTSVRHDEMETARLSFECWAQDEIPDMAEWQRDARRVAREEAF